MASVHRTRTKLTVDLLHSQEQKRSTARLLVGEHEGNILILLYTNLFELIIFLHTAVRIYNRLVCTDGCAADRCLLFSIHPELKKKATSS